MSPQLLFGINVGFSFLAWGIVTQQYIWPRLRDLPRPDALRPILLLHGFRFVGLAFLIPGVVSADLPPAFAVPAAYGDLVTAVLALLAFAGLGRPAGLALVWVFNIVGVVDLLHAFYLGRVSLGSDPGLQGAAYFIPTLLVPFLLVTHGLTFRLLLMKERH